MREGASKVTDNAGRNRFEMEGGGGHVAHLDYRRERERIVLVHTEVPEALSGQGVGSRLVQGALDRIRTEGLRVVARCSFVAGYIERHPTYRDLLADPR